MTRLWIGIALLIALLAMGILTAVLMPAYHMPVAQKLEQAATLTRAGEYAAALTAFEDARRIWESHRDFTASVCDHDVQDEMDALFARISQEAASAQWSEFGADCAELATRAEDLSKLHGISLPQILACPGTV